LDEDVSQNYNSSERENTQESYSQKVDNSQSYQQKSKNSESNLTKNSSYQQNNGSFGQKPQNSGSYQQNSTVQPPNYGSINVNNSGVGSNQNTYVRPNRGVSSSAQQGKKTQWINSTPYLIWSIVNTVCCCLPLGIAGIVFAIKINDATTYEEAEKNKKTAMILCIVGSAVGAVVSILYLFAVMISAALS
jgi:DNA mismatch repair ATPase MutL